jgi:phosphoglycerol transferase MdoB-like AlkP superfamily enzyme
MAPVFPGTDEQTRFLNAQAYTDRSLGDFVRKAKTEPWWARTLVIIMADHGHRLPVLGPNEADRRWEVYHIPMLWLGGALARRDTVIRRLGAQTDFPRTLLDQMGVASGQYRWSRDLLAPGIRDFAYFAFEDGFGWVKSDGAYTWDNVGKAVMFQEGRITSADVRDGQAMLQATIADYVAR